MMEPLKNNVYEVTYGDLRPYGGTFEFVKFTELIEAPDLATAEGIFRRNSNGKFISIKFVGEFLNE